MLEAGQHRDNAFVTLTYDEDHVPKGGSLAPEEIRNWLKRLRKSVAPAKFRYYVVGEYGDKNGRPHYHAALFGYPRCLYGMSRYNRERQTCCYPCDLVRSTWGLGNIYLGTLETKSAQYVAGYVIKKMTRFDDPRLPPGHHPEFCRMSLKPGIGTSAMDDVADTVLQFNLHTMQGDVPSSLQHGKKLLPLGRYLRKQLRLRVGMDAKAPEIFNKAYEQEILQIVRDYTGIDPLSVPVELRKYFIKNALVDASAQKVLNTETRRAIFKKAKPL